MQVRRYRLKASRDRTRCVGRRDGDDDGDGDGDVFLREGNHEGALSGKSITNLYSNLVFLARDEFSTSLLALRSTPRVFSLSDFFFISFFLSDERQRRQLERAMAGGARPPQQQRNGNSVQVSNRSGRVGPRFYHVDSIYTRTSRRPAQAVRRFDRPNAMCFGVC